MLTPNTDFNQQNLNKAVCVLLEIKTPTPIRLVGDNTDWTLEEHTFTAFPFKINGIEETTKGEIPKVTVSVSNVTNLVTQLLEEDIDNIDVRILVAREGESEADVEYNFVCNGYSYNAEWVTFDLTAPVSFVKSFPQTKYTESCPFVFKGWQCKYSGSATTCDHTAQCCQNLGNLARFGGFTNETV